MSSVWPSLYQDCFVNFCTLWPAKSRVSASCKCKEVQLCSKTRAIELTLCLCLSHPTFASVKFFSIFQHVKSFPHTQAADEVSVFLNNRRFLLHPRCIQQIFEARAICCPQWTSIHSLPPGFLTYICGTSYSCAVVFVLVFPNVVCGQRTTIGGQSSTFLMQTSNADWRSSVWTMQKAVSDINPHNICAMCACG